MRERVVGLWLVAAGACVGAGCEDPATTGGIPTTTGVAPSTTAVIATMAGATPTTGEAGAPLTGGGSAPTSGGTQSTSGGMTASGMGTSTSGIAPSGTGDGGTASTTTAAPDGGAAEGGVLVDAGGSTQDAAGPVNPPLGEAQTLVPDPSWNCGLPEGIVPPTLGTEVFRGAVSLGEIHELGQTQFGERRLIEFGGGGSLAGASFDGEFLEGGLDWELTLPTGSLEIEQVGVLRMSDGTSIYYRACGVSPSGSDPARMVADFEAPNSSDYAWLNTGTYVGVRQVDPATGALEIAFYDVSGVSRPQDEVVVTDPADLPHQAWECPERSGSEGTQLFRETVGIGDTIRVGASKRGTRTIIPITGGSVSGMITGDVLKGGADYQLSAGGFTLDARYTLRSDDGVLILVRNCGAASGLVPEFETPVDGPYDFLNRGSFLSSSPGLGIGSVNLTIYERR